MNWSLYELKRRSTAPAVVAFGLILTACAGGSLTERAGGRSFAVGENLVGETCRVAPSAGTQGLYGSDSAFDVTCGTWDEPSARIAVFDQNTGQIPGSWARGLARRATCDLPASAPSAGGVPISVSCKLNRGGWPYQAELVSVSGQMFLTDSIPAAGHAARRAVAVLSGQADAETSSGSTQQDIAELEAAIGSRLYTAGDIAGFDQMMELALRHNFQGNFAEAARQYRRALDVQRRILPADDYRQGQVLMHLALELSNLQEFTRADGLFEQAGRLVANSPEPTDGPRLTSYRALHMANQRQFEAALKLAREANAARLAILRNQNAMPGASGVGYGDSGAERYGAAPVLLPVVKTAMVDLVQSRYLEIAMLRRLGRNREALSVLRDVQGFVAGSAVTSKGWRSRLYLIEAEIAEDLNRPSRAAAALRRAIESERSHAVDTQVEAMALVNRGRLLVAMGQGDNGLASIKEGFDVLTRTGLPVPSASLAPFFELVVNTTPGTSLRSGLEREAVRGVQLIQSPVIASSLALAQARLSAQDTDAAQAIRELQDLRKRRDETHARLTAAVAEPQALAPRVEYLDREVKAIEERIEDAELAVQSALPAYQTLFPAAVPAENLQEVLEPDEALVVLQVTNDRSYGVFVSKESVQVYGIDLPQDDAMGLINAMRFSIDIKPGAPYDVALAKDAYDMLFGPVDGLVRGKAKLSVVPTGPLLSLPFSMLITDVAPGAGQDLTAHKWLIQRHAVSVMPAVKTLDFSRRSVEPTRAPQRFAGFGGETYEGYDERFDTLRGGRLAGLDGPGATADLCRRDIALLSNLAPLPGAAAEIQAIAGELGDERLTRRSLNTMSEAEVKAFDFSRYKVVHFATHGLLPGDLDCFREPALVLGSNEPAGSDDDGLLSASEVSELNFDADLVILSACNTGVLEDQYGGEGLASLTRMFFYAGVRGLLVSHWAISDEATKNLMIAFFRNLKGGRTGAEAIQGAQLDLLADPRTAHPFFWSAFVYIGEGGERIGL